MHQNHLALELLPPDGQSHGDSIELSPVDAHEPISEAGIQKLTLTPMFLKIATKAYVTGIGEELAFSTGEPVGLIQQADPIPCRQIGQPSLDIPMKFLIQLDSVVEVPSFHGCFDHMAEEGSTRPENPAHEVQFAYKR